MNLRGPLFCCFSCDCVCVCVMFFVSFLLYFICSIRNRNLQMMKWIVAAQRNQPTWPRASTCNVHRRCSLYVDLRANNSLICCMFTTSTNHFVHITGRTQIKTSKTNEPIHIIMLVHFEYTSTIRYTRNIEKLRNALTIIMYYLIDNVYIKRTCERGAFRERPVSDASSLDASTEPTMQWNRAVHWANGRIHQ